MSPFDQQTIHGLRYGGVGAFLYALLSLGQRSFQHDVTTGSATWCAVQLVMGPLLGAVLSHVFIAPSSGADPSLTSSGMIGLLLPAGFAPRFVVNSVQDFLRRIWFPTTGSTMLTQRSMPLSQVRGVTPVIEERLNEEGIYDAYNLAMADPLKFFRNTPFERRQILAWIDEAILMATLPQTWQILENEGFTGAIDLGVTAVPRLRKDELRMT